MVSRIRHYIKYITKKNESLVSRQSFELVNCDVNQTSGIISKWLSDGCPFIVSRFGNIELEWYLNYKILSRNFSYRFYSYIFNIINYWKSSNRLINHHYFRPNNNLVATKYFIEKMDQVIPEIDFLASWRAAEQHDSVKLKQCKFYSHLFDIEPYKSEYPWTLCLEGKKVLIIHPMVDLFVSQMKHKDKLFNKRVLPDFTIVPVKALFFDDPVYDTWPKMYEYYKDIIFSVAFDVAIIGCGTWGMPLCYEIKKLGKQAIHLGGATQILFGIMGKRWLQWPEYASMVNEYWITKHENPPAIASSIEDGCYW